VPCMPSPGQDVQSCRLPSCRRPAIRRKGPYVSSCRLPVRPRSATLPAPAEIPSNKTVPRSAETKIGHRGKGTDRFVAPWLPPFPVHLLPAIPAPLDATPWRIAGRDMWAHNITSGDAWLACLPALPQPSRAHAHRNAPSCGLTAGHLSPPLCFLFFFPFSGPLSCIGQRTRACHPPVSVEIMHRPRLYIHIPRLAPRG
jgi:hypothetical protein